MSHATRLVGVEDSRASKDAILRVEWNLGRRCNFDCSYCSPGTHDKTSPHLSWDLIERTLDRLAFLSRREGKKMRLSLTGGEPYLHPDFLRLLTAAKQKGIERLSVTTNGSLREKTYLESLAYLNQIIFSFHFEFGDPDRFLALVTAVKANVVGTPKEVHVHMMAMPGKAAEVKRMAEVLERLGVSLVIRRIRPQFSQNGGYVMPFQSGRLGVAKQVSPPSEPYYSAADLQVFSEEGP